MANLPWNIEPHDGYVCEDDTVPPIQIVDASGDVVADNVQFYPRAITADRAELIVRTVNAHDELLSALKDAADNGLIYWEPQTDRGHIAKAQMLARINSLLAKHGGAQ